jgi:hypothetical protein
MEGSVLSFLKAEWKVSDTGSAHWAYSLLIHSNSMTLTSLLLKIPHFSLFCPRGRSHFSQAFKSRLCPKWFLHTDYEKKIQTVMVNNSTNEQLPLTSRKLWYSWSYIKKMSYNGFYTALTDINVMLARLKNCCSNNVINIYTALSYMSWHWS